MQMGDEGVTEVREPFLVLNPQARAFVERAQYAASTASGAVAGQLGVT
jgi:hypothetical protein